ncbi:MAG: bifunctional riboflavin kinase/FAD synthetase [Bacteroidales bacterium]|nr:bifunctional riboflavin kinase/FAD synthetase [Bacteroidales bacterium]
MRVFHNIIETRHIPNAVVTIGTFDGVHLGHQAIFSKMKELAQSVEGQTVVVTFHPHPRQVLNIDSSNLRFLTTPEEKLAKFEEFGIDNVVIIPFTKEFSRTPSEVFLKDYIIDNIKPAYIVVGYDHHFGKNRMGDFGLLNDLKRKYSFEVERVAAQDVENIAVSSTKIRNALAVGNVKSANRLLGYTYSVTAEVVMGNKIGRTLGFPTANLELPREYMLLNGGVYACLVDYADKQYKAMANIGHRPTIGDRNENQPIIEVNLFGFDGDLYGKKIRVQFLDRIRDEVKFSGLDALKAQLEEDRERVYKLLYNIDL